MAYVNTARAAAPSLLGLVAHPLNSLRLMAHRRRVYVQTLSELRDLSDRDLADLGLHRSLIQVVAREAAYGK